MVLLNVLIDLDQALVTEEDNRLARLADHLILVARLVKVVPD